MRLSGNGLGAGRPFTTQMTAQAQSPPPPSTAERGGDRFFDAIWLHIFRENQLLCGAVVVPCIIINMVSVVVFAFVGNR